jgi:ABC-type dipeptide/oligopeptide/nickel transport system permease component
MVLLVLVTTFVLSTLMSQNVNLNRLQGGEGGLIPWDAIEAERIRIGYYDPWNVKFVKYFTSFFAGDWGTSYFVAYGTPVLELIFSMWPRTIELVIIPMILIPILSVKIGVISAKNRNNWIDTFIRGGMMLGVCLPVFWLASLLQYFVGSTISDFTLGVLNFETQNPNAGAITGSYIRITGFRLIDGFLTNDQNLIHDTLLRIYLPAFCMVIVSLAGISRQTRASMLEVMQKDYIRTARAKGVPSNIVLNKHALRNALIPSSGAIVGNVAGLLGGSLFIEMRFNYKGLGFYATQSILRGDYVVVNGILVISAFIVLFGILVSDILYTIIDPRIVYT